MADEMENTPKEYTDLNHLSDHLGLYRLQVLVHRDRFRLSYNKLRSMLLPARSHSASSAVNGWVFQQIAWITDAPEGLGPGPAQSFWLRFLRRDMAGHPQTSASMLAFLSQDQDDGVRLRVAQNKNVPISVLNKLASDRTASVRAAVCDHPNTPEATLGMCSQDKQITVRYRVASNTNTGLSTLLHLSQDESLLIRYAVAMNAKTSIDILVHMESDPNVKIQMAVKKRFVRCVIAKLKFYMKRKTS